MAYDNTNPKIDPIYATRALELADVIEKSPSYNQEAWLHPCGTPACVAGHAVWVEKGFHNGTDVENFSDIDFHNTARAWLGLSTSQGGLMLSPEGGAVIDDLDKIIFGATSAQAAAMLRNYAVTGEVVWPPHPKAG